VDGRDRVHATARESERGTLHRVRAGRVTATDQRVLEQLRQVGRELLDEPVPQAMLDILRAGEDQRD
jgi:hypothetical protein